MREEMDEEFENFLALIDRELTKQFGPNHQEVLSQGKIVSQFKWWENEPQG